jgi:hypothetical protein
MKKKELCGNDSRDGSKRMVERHDYTPAGRLSSRARLGDFWEQRVAFK